ARGYAQSHPLARDARLRSTRSGSVRRQGGGEGLTSVDDVRAKVDRDFDVVCEHRQHQRAQKALLIAAVVAAVVAGPGQAGLPRILAQLAIERRVFFARADEVKTGVTRSGIAAAAQETEQPHPQAQVDVVAVAA